MEKAIAVPTSTIRHRPLLITGLIIAMLFAALDGTIVGTAMPRIVGELHGLGIMTWLTTAYMLTSTTVVPIAGKLADLLGPSDCLCERVGHFYGWFSALRHGERYDRAHRLPRHSRTGRRDYDADGDDCHR